jgi:ATP-dependent RNA helicase RhlE
MARGVDILVATPGRLLDLVQQKHVRLDAVQVFVVDEADRMLDMGFIRDVRRLAALLPKARQSMLFSATMPTDAQRLADSILRNPVSVAVTPPSTTDELISQSVYFVEKADKRNFLVKMLDDPELNRVLVFTRTKHGANRVSEALDKAGIDSAAIHGNKSQNARERALAGFKEGSLRVLVATDIAARGIDVDDVSHVINFELPNVPETYVHRIGRTARAGKGGIAVSFCEQEERPFLRDIERLTRQKIPVATDLAFRSPLPPPSGTSPAYGDAPASRGPMRPAPPPRAHHPQRDPAPGSRPPAPRPPQQRPGTAHLQPTHWDADGSPITASPGGRPGGGGGGNRPGGGGGRRRRRGGRGPGPRP